MNVDAAGVVHETDTALNKLSSMANAPIFSYDDYFFGEAIVGGPMYSVREGSQITAAVAIRILNGEKAGDIKTPPIKFAAPKFDWRQMQRWGISDSILPAWQHSVLPGTNGMGALFVANCAYRRRYSLADRAYLGPAT